MRAFLSCSFIILREVHLKNVSPSVMWNLRGVCWQIDCRWQVSYIRLWEFATQNSNAYIWKRKHFSWSFGPFHGSTSNLKHFEKNMIVTAILTFGSKYFVQNFENLKLPIQMQLCEKRSLFSEVFAPFLDSISNFEHFERKYHRHSEYISEITDCENLC